LTCWSEKSEHSSCGQASTDCLFRQLANGFFLFRLKKFLSRSNSCPRLEIVFGSPQTVVVPFENVQDGEHDGGCNVDPVGYQNFQIIVILLDEASDVDNHQDEYEPPDDVLDEIDVLLRLGLVIFLLL